MRTLKVGQKITLPIPVCRRRDRSPPLPRMPSQLVSFFLHSSSHVSLGRPRPLLPSGAHVTFQHPGLRVALGVRREAPGDLIRLRGSSRLCPISVILVTPEFQLRKLSSGSSHVARRHPQMSLSITFSVSLIKYFYRVQGLAAHPTPNLEDQ